MGTGEESSPSRSRRRRRHDDESDNDSSSESSEGSSVDSSDEERRRKRRKKDKRRSKHHSKRRHKSEKKRRKKRRHSSSSSSEEDDGSESESERRKKKKLLKDARKLLKEAKRAEGQQHQQQQQQASTKMKFDKITEDDYYLKSNEFAAWLKEERRIYFSNLTSQEARKLFVEFVGAWNDGKLADKYYEGIKTAPRSNHKWNIKAEDPVEKEEKWERNRKLEKLEQKKFQKDHEVVMDELLPKATGKERLFEKKVIERQKKRERELSPEPMKESDIMGGGDDFKQMLARERARREKRAAAKAEAMHTKVSAAEEKEMAAMDQFRALLNTAGGKISIPKRT